MAKEFITEDNLNTLFSKTAPTKADTLQGGGYWYSQDLVTLILEVWLQQYRIQKHFLLNAV